MVCWAMLTGAIPISYTGFCILYFLIGQGGFGYFITTFSCNSKNFPEADRAKILGYFLSAYGLSAMIFTFVYDMINRDLNTFFLVLWVTTVCVGVPATFLIKAVPNEEPADQEPLQVHDSFQRDEDHSGEAPVVAAKEKKKKGITGVELFKSKDFWLLFCTFFCFTGPCLMWKNIIGTVGTAFSLSDDFINGLIYGWSGFNALFRVLVGFLADYFAGKTTPYLIVRPMWLVFAGCLASIVDLLYLATGESFVWTINIFNTLIYATAFAIISTEVSVRFGVDFFGFNMGMCSLAPAISGLVFTSLSTTFTTSEIEEGDDACYGKHCFTSTFLLGGVTFAVGCVLAVLLSATKNQSKFNDDLPMSETAVNYTNFRDLDDEDGHE